MKRILFASPYWHEALMQGIARHASSHGWHINLETALSGKLPRDWHGDGILTTIGDDLTGLQRFWKRAQCPAVSLSLNHPHLDIPRVGINNQPAGELAAEHLLDRGFQNFAFYDRTGQHAGHQRCEAFASALAVMGFEVRRLFAPFEDPKEAGLWTGRQRMIEHLLREIDKPCAVFASDDFAGVEVIEACQSLGLNIPHDVAVLGMLDIPLFRQSTTITLSSITVDFDEQTRMACDLLASLMDGQPAPTRPILLNPTGIAVRQSTDVIAAKTPGVAKAVRYMMEHYAKPIDVPDIVKISGMSQTALYEAFRRDTGQPPATVLTRIRLDKAKQRLTRSKDTIEAISHDCGFGDRVNLYRQFKQQLDITPGEYRKQTRAEAEAENART